MRNGSLLNDAKGRFAETLVQTLLEYAGYRVLRLGVEEMISEVKAGAARREDSLRLPEQLRTAPDFLVVDPETGVCTLLEVKFRRTFDDRVAEELHRTLSRQVSHWPGTVLAVICAGAPDASPHPDVRDYVRCLSPQHLDRLVEDHPERTRWQRFRSLGGVFERLARTDLYTESEALTGPIRAWAEESL